MDSEPTDRKFCLAPWISLRITNFGNVLPCCNYRGSLGNVSSGVSILDIWKGKDFQNLRQDFLDGKRHAGCSDCWTRESKIEMSHRHRLAKRYSPLVDPLELTKVNPEPNFLELDLSFGNRCNLRCRMCGSWGSHRWVDEELTLTAQNPRLERGEPHSHKLRQVESSTVEDILTNVDNLKRVNIKGGEPFINPEVPKFLTQLISSGVSSKIMLAFVTNGTTIPRWAEDIFPQFRTVGVTVSLDGTGKVYQYIRGGEAFEFERDILPTVEFFNRIPNLLGSFNTTVQIYSAYDLPNIANFVRSNPYKRFSKKLPIDTMVTKPAYLQIDILPYDIRQEIADQMENYARQSGFTGFLPLIRSLRVKQIYPPDEQGRLLALFREFTQTLDQNRGTSLLTVEPRFERLFQAPQEEGTYRTPLETQETTL